MGPHRQQLISDLFHAALARPPEERTAFLKEACEGDPALQEKLESLLREEFVATRSPDGPAAATVPDGPAPAAEMVGRQLGPYLIVARLGAGGMGEVYRARDTRLNRAVALKFIASDFVDTELARKRFEQEARAIASLSHANICVLHDVGSANGIEFLVMEYLEGETLAEHLARRGALPLVETLRIATELADALTVAHRAGIVHRDLKPANIILARSGGARNIPQVKVLDFGLAKLQSQSRTAPSQQTVTGLPLTGRHAVFGTLPYMAPEQLQGRHTDARADLFAFGAILYEMASGRRAFSGDSQATLIAAILDRDPEPLITVQPLTPPGLDRVVRKCLAKDPDARWQSADDLADELRWIAAGRNEGQATPTPEADPPRRAARLVLVAIAVVLGLAAAASFWKWRETVPPEPTEVQHRQVTFTGEVRAAALSPDGRTVAYAVGEPGREMKVLVRDVTADEASVIWTGLFVSTLSWLPGGVEIAVGRKQSQPGAWIVPRMGGIARPVANGLGTVFAVSPDGESFASTADGNPPGFGVRSRKEAKQHWAPAAGSSRRDSPRVVIRWRCFGTDTQRPRLRGYCPGRGARSASFQRPTLSR